MLTDDEIFVLAEPFGAFEFGDAQGDKRIAFARAVEKAAYEAAYRAVKGRDTGGMQREDIEARRCAEAIAELMQEQPK